MPHLNPWDRRPRATVGDPTEDITFAAVGRALTGWELFEVWLSRIFAELTGYDRGTSPAMRAYGAIMAFGSRADMVKAAAEAYFTHHPSPGIHNRLRDLLKLALKYSPRRNEIAHGIVYDLSQRGIASYYLMPPEYASNKMEMSSGKYRVVSHFRFKYASPDINHFTDCFRADLEMTASDLWRETEALNSARREASQ